MRFLVADDSKIAREKMVSYINEMGYTTVAKASDGVEAVELFKQFNPDFVIIDLEMPNLKGIEASTMMLEINKNINIVLVTSIVDKKELISALKIGIKKVLRKPVSFDMFNVAINELNDRNKK